MARPVTREQLTHVDLLNDQRSSRKELAHKNLPEDPIGFRPPVYKYKLPEQPGRLLQASGGPGASTLALPNIVELPVEGYANFTCKVRGLVLAGQINLMIPPLIYRLWAYDGGDRDLIAQSIVSGVFGVSVVRFAQACDRLSLDAALYGVPASGTNADIYLQFSVIGVP